MAQAVQNSPGTPRTNAAPAVSWRITFTHAVAFVLGFGLVFTLLGSAAGLLGYRLTVYLPYLQKGGAILLVIFGLTTLGVFRWAVKEISQRTDLTTNPAAAGLVDVLDFFNVLLYTERRVTEMHQVKRGWGYVSSLLMGVSFSAGWVPCVGPILASILFIASDKIYYICTWSIIFWNNYIKRSNNRIASVAPASCQALWNHGSCLKSKPFISIFLACIVINFR